MDPGAGNPETWRQKLNDWIGAPPAIVNTPPVFVPWTFFLLGLGICLTRLMVSLRRTRRLIRESAPIADPHVAGIATEVARRIGLRRAPQLAYHSGLTSPLYAAGTILLPDESPSDDELRMILAHEMAHARRRDLVYEIIGVVVQTLFFFDPFVLLARREERLARESAADALALRVTGAAPAVYAYLLLDLATDRRLRPLDTGTVGAVEGGRLLHRRIEALRFGVAPQRPSSRVVAWGIAVLSAVGCVVPVLFVPSPVSAKWIVKNWMPGDDPYLHAPADATGVFGDKQILAVVRDAQGKKLAGTSVRLMRAFFGDQSSRDVRAAFTSADGTVVFRDLPTGEYQVAAAPPIQPDMDRKAGEAALADWNRYYGTTMPFYISASRLSPMVVTLTKYRWGAVRGRLIDHRTGAPIAGVFVEGSKSPGAGWKGVTPWSQCMTDGDGQFALKIDWIGPTTIGAGTTDPFGEQAAYCRVAQVQRQCVVSAEGESINLPDLTGERLPILKFVAPVGETLLGTHVSLTPEDAPDSPYSAQRLGVYPGSHGTQGDQTDGNGALLLRRLKEGKFTATTPDGRFTAIGSFQETPNGALAVTVGNVRRSFADGVGEIMLSRALPAQGSQKHAGTNP